MNGGASRWQQAIAGRLKSVAPTVLRKKPFGKPVEWLSSFQSGSYVADPPVQEHDFEHSTHCCMVRRPPFSSGARKYSDIIRSSSCALRFRESIAVEEPDLDETTSLLLRLLDEYGVRLHALLTKITLREDVAEELLQDLFLKLRKADGFAHAPRPEQYLFRSAINLAFNWRSRKGREVHAAPLNGEEACSRPSPIEHAIRREELERVMLAVERLPPRDRELVVLRFLHGSSFEELADQLSSTPHRVRALCSKAVVRLR
jgi:RNA polymerase sigma-70 factor (ECF subfamily)